jgi:hypothetical protein
MYFGLKPGESCYPILEIVEKKKTYKIKKPQKNEGADKKGLMNKGKLSKQIGVEEE